MGNAINQDARALWLMMRRDGGWWSASMLTHHWRPTFVIGEITAHLDALAAGGFLQEREQLGTKNYCVTSSCTPLPGCSLEEGGDQ
jgi:hypothetical protein